jgi:transposase
VIRNRLHSLLHRHNLALPEEGLISWEWWEQQELSALEKLQVRQEIALPEEISKHKAQVDAELGKLSTGKLWGKQAKYLMQLPGIGVIVAMTVLGAIGDVRRFEDARSLVGYAGLGAGVHSSGKEHKEKRITKSGRKELRWAMADVTIVEVKIRRTQTPHAPNPGDRGNCSQTVGSGLACAEQGRNGSPCK